MRIKDEEKIKRVRQACIDLMFELGVEGISAGKLAKKANVSASSIYVYYKNMQDMLVVINTELITEFFNYIIRPVDNKNTVKENFDLIWDASYKYCTKYYKEFIFMMRLGSSCVVDYSENTKIKDFHVDLNEFLLKAISEKQIKNIDVVSFIYIAFYPLYGVVKANIEVGINSLSDDILNVLRTAAWDAVKK